MSRNNEKVLILLVVLAAIVGVGTLVLAALIGLLGFQLTLETQPVLIKALVVVVLALFAVVVSLYKG